MKPPTGSFASARDRPVPSITTDQMREVDRLMVEEYGVDLVQMMENAGRHLAHLARHRFLDGDPRGRSVVVLAGTGGNGGGGLVAARRLQGWGAEVHVLTSRSPDAYEGVPAHQLRALESMGIRARSAADRASLPDAALLLDALIGYSLSGAPRGTAATLVRVANAHEAPVLSLDVPSGVDATTGAVRTPAIRAAATLTLALPKTGLAAGEASDVTGALYLGDIGVPPSLYAASGLGLDVAPLFAESDLLSLTPLSDDRFRARPLR